MSEIVEEGDLLYSRADGANRVVSLSETHAYVRMESGQLDKFPLDEVQERVSNGIWSVQKPAVFMRSDDYLHEWIAAENSAASILDMGDSTA